MNWEGIVPVPPTAPALGAMMTYYLFWSYHSRENPGSGDETPVSVQFFYDFSKVNFYRLIPAKR